MMQNFGKRAGIVAAVAAAACVLGAGAAQAEPPAYYSRTYRTHSYIDYGPAYVPRTTTYIHQPVVRERVVYTAPVTYVAPVYRPVYHRPYYPVRAYAPVYRPYRHRRAYYGHRGGHRSWGFGIGGGHYGGGASFYNRGR